MFWAVLALATTTVFFLLAVLGAMRETVLLRGQVEALSQLVRHPPPPSYVGGRAPEALVRAIEMAGETAVADGPLAVAFVSPGCAPCEDLVAGLAAAVEDSEVGREDV